MNRMRRLAVMIMLGSGVILSCDSAEENDCDDLGGNYAVAKTVNSLACTLKGDKLKVQNRSGMLPNSSNLTIIQGSCGLTGTESFRGSDLEIPYFGSADGDDFTLQIQNPEQLALPLTLELGGVKHECSFNGAIVWEGSEDNGGLAGTIRYDLEKRKGEGDAACPDTCILNLNFTTD